MEGQRTRVHVQTEPDLFERFSAIEVAAT